LGLNDFLQRDPVDIVFYGRVFNDTYRAYTEAMVRTYDDESTSTTGGKYKTSSLDRVFANERNASESSDALESIDGYAVRSSIVMMSLTKGGDLSKAYDGKKSESKKAAASQFVDPAHNPDFTGEMQIIDEARFISPGASAPISVDPDEENYGFFVPTLGQTGKSPRTDISKLPNHVMYLFWDGTENIQVTTVYMHGTWMIASSIFENEKSSNPAWVPGIDGP
jgi:hypothetical protein